MKALAAEPCSITVTLRAGATEDFVVRSVDLFGGGLKVRVSTSSRTAIGEIFSGAFAALIRRFCEAASQRTEVISYSDLSTRIGRLMIRGVVLMVRVAECGARQLIVRIREAVGAAFEIFRPEAVEAEGLGMRMATSRDRSAERLFLPLTNLEHYIEQVMLTGQDARPDRLRSALGELHERIAEVTFAMRRRIALDRLEIGDAADTPDCADGEVPGLTSRQELPVGGGDS